MTQQFLSALAEAFMVAGDYSDRLMTNQLAAFLELSLEPSKQLVYFMTHPESMTAGCDAITLQEIEQYLIEKVRQ